MGERQKKESTSKIKRKGFWKYIEEFLIKHLGAMGYAVQGLLGGLVLHIVFWSVHKVQSIFIIDDIILNKAMMVVGVLDACGIVICALAGFISLGIHHYYDIKRVHLRESTETKKIMSRYGALPGKTANIANELAADIATIEVEED